jgi:predicted PurR-regulated permease PerM
LDDLIVQFSFGKQVKAMRIVRKAEEKLGGWLRGQLALSLIIGLAAYILLSALNIPYALPLAVLAGIMEVVPVIGPIVSAIPAILIAYISAPFSAIWVALGYFVIQQLENHLVEMMTIKSFMHNICYMLNIPNQTQGLKLILGHWVKVKHLIC